MMASEGITPPLNPPPPLSPSHNTLQTPPTSSPKIQEQQRRRTKDIQIDHDVDFSELLLSPPILKGLSEAGYPKSYYYYFMLSARQRR